MEQNKKDSMDLEELYTNVLFEDAPGETVKEVTPEHSKKTAPKAKEAMPVDKVILMYLHDLVFLLAGIMIVFLLCFRVVVVSGTSMNATLYDGDYLLLLGNALYKDVQQGDIIVVSKDSFDNGAPIVKRIIATEGQWVDIDFVKGKVYVGDTKDTLCLLTEPYTLTPTNLFEGISFPLQVEENCVFVLGDNRNGSKDSRNPEIGQIDRREILGKAIFLFVPGTNHGEKQRDYGRIGVIS